MPAVSVMVAIFNVKEYLALCLESILKQRMADMEIILVNDGSTDGSEKLCEEYAHLDSRIIVINKVNGGLFSARNAGLAIAKGEYLYFMDGDDWIEPELIQENYSLAKQGDYEVILFGHIKELQINNESVNKITSCPPDVSFKSKSEGKSKLLKLFQAGCGFAVWEQLIKATVIKENRVQFPPFKRGTDMSFLLEVYNHTDSLVTNGQIYYHYNAYNSQRKFNPDIIENHIQLFETYLQVFQNPRETSTVHPYTIQLFVLWFGHVIPSNVLANSLFTFIDKIRFLKKLLRSDKVLRWINSFRLKDAKGMITRILLLSLRSKNLYLIYLMTWLKGAFKGNVGIDYKKWFYKPT